MIRSKIFWAGRAVIIAALASGRAGRARSPGRAADLDPSKMSADEIKALEQRLTDAGCYKGAIDGAASAALDGAIKACPDQRPFLRIETGMHTAPIRRIGVDAACSAAGDRVRRQDRPAVVPARRQASADRAPADRRGECRQGLRGGFVAGRALARRRRMGRRLGQDGEDCHHDRRSVERRDPSALARSRLPSINIAFSARRAARRSWALAEQRRARARQRDRGGTACRP